MDGVSGVAPPTTPTSGEQTSGLSADEQDKLAALSVQFAGNVMGMQFALLRSIMSQANKPPQ